MPAITTPRCSRCAADMPVPARFCSSCGAPAYSPDDATIASDSPAPALRDFPASVGREHGTSITDPSSALSDARFVPGQLLVERYRIVALVGKGGMGEVYRAEDLRLGQTVALKFLPERLARDGAALARFHREVRVARQVSHPNVCRVFDIGETQDLPFLAMEYVDGEDLASLLRRIGRLPQDKALEIARQLCAGLAAAHDSGVLHRDLKPANVMLDGRGKVRITDFGLAGIQGDAPTGGTPAYMAPEQLSGNPATVQSDIYALGLVFYEIFTGKQAFTASTLAELLQQRAHTTPVSLSKLVIGLDPLVERVIMRCLETDPTRRPASALQVAAALPGGDPLAAALAAGETPSPEMVAAAGGEGALRPRTAWILLASTLACVAVILFLARYSRDLNLAPMQKTPEVIEDRAQEIVKQMGYTDPPADHAFWMERNYELLRYRAWHLPSPKRVRELAQAEQGVLTCIYRQSPRFMVPSNVASRVNSGDPPYEVSGMVTVILDSNGKLLTFGAVAPQLEPPKSESEPDWTALFNDAGLNLASFKRAEPRWVPPVPFDRRIAWDGSYPQSPETPIHVVGASFAGKLVYFHVIGPWTRPWRMQEAPQSSSARIRDATLILSGFLTVVLAAIFARRNLRLGRGDRKGAFRLSAFLFSATFLSGMLMAHHVLDVHTEWGVLGLQVAGALLVVFFVWLYYIALEPYVRRQWPELLISWSRLLSGGFRDPSVGRDILVGALAGSAFAICTHLSNALPYWLNLPGETPIAGNLLTLGPAIQVLGVFAQNQVNAIFSAFAILVTLVLVRAMVRRQWVSVMIVAVLVAVINFGGENFGLETPFAIVVTALMMFVLLRFGLLALALTLLVDELLIDYPMTLDFSRWYASRTMFVLAVLAALAIYGFRTALGNQPVLGGAVED